MSGHPGNCACLTCVAAVTERGDYNAVLDGLVEKVPRVYAGYITKPEHHEPLPISPRAVLEAIDAPSLVLLLREAREELIEQAVGEHIDDLITRIDAHLAITPQPSTSPADV